ncbi:hypothetical protein SEA_PINEAPPLEPIZZA_22 [Microbacterium phage PineapplePizza]|uniref:Uncharacterized protein n=1 Tax=Microbacterium phage PineapplePizza TaxID=2927268 RepID=A0A976YDK5_9CAUD|nr:hypothetical protein QEH41_gp22 [Microbacterium phage PineapplePizza]UVF60430.1 hypothetical protein SEA_PINEAPPLEPIZZA_22 [Microbacterium phage PineapplePizza]
MDFIYTIAITLTASGLTALLGHAIGYKKGELAGYIRGKRQGYVEADIVNATNLFNGREKKSNA